MTKGLLGRKVGMTQLYNEAGQVVPVTVIQAGPCHVLQLRTEESDGYEAVQLGYLDKPRNKAVRAERGHVAKLNSKRAKQLAAKKNPPVAKAGCEPKRFIRELRCPIEGLEVGQQLTVEAFAEVRAVDVVGTSKGRGFAGVMKRHNFAGQRASHGVKKVHRHPGGTGSHASTGGGGKPKKGKHMAGHYGNQRVTVRNLKVVSVDTQNHLLVVRGAVPGPNGGFLIIRETNKV